jgi:hypothetical protein
MTGILAFGSLIRDPGDELRPLIEKRIKTETPFPVEFGRFSATRGGAPTLVPHARGERVKAEILVLKESVSVRDATDMLWRRETRQKDKTKPYPAGETPGSVQVVQLTNFQGVNVVLYTDFLDTGKIKEPSSANLARGVIESVSKAPANQDGITYLLEAMSAGIETPLTKTYCEEIQRQTNTASLIEARDRAMKMNPSPATKLIEDPPDSSACRSAK